MKSGTIKREMYLRKILEIRKVLRGCMWHLIKLPYGINEAGSQWVIVLEKWMLTEVGFGRVYVVRKMFVRRGADRVMQFIALKVTEDLLFAGT